MAVQGRCFISVKQLRGRATDAMHSIDQHCGRSAMDSATCIGIVGACVASCRNSVEPSTIRRAKFPNMLSTAKDRIEATDRVKKYGCQMDWKVFWNVRNTGAL